MLYGLRSNLDWEETFSVENKKPGFFFPPFVLDLLVRTCEKFLCPLWYPVAGGNDLPPTPWDVAVEQDAPQTHTALLWFLPHAWELWADSAHSHGSSCGSCTRRWSLPPAECCLFPDFRSTTKAKSEWIEDSLLCSELFLASFLKQRSHM